MSICAAMPNVIEETKELALGVTMKRQAVAMDVAVAEMEVAHEVVQRAGMMDMAAVESASKADAMMAPGVEVVAALVAAAVAPARMIVALAGLHDEEVGEAAAFLLLRRYGMLWPEPMVLLPWLRCALLPLQLSPLQLLQPAALPTMPLACGTPLPVRLRRCWWLTPDACEVMPQSRQCPPKTRRLLGIRTQQNCSGLDAAYAGHHLRRWRRTCRCSCCP